METLIMAQLTFGETIKRRRDELGLTQLALAELMDTRQSTVANWEMRALPIKDREMLIRLARAMRMSEEELLGIDQPSQSEDPSVEEIRFSLLSAQEDLSPEDLQSVAVVVKAMVEDLKRRRREKEDFERRTRSAERSTGTEKEGKPRR